MISELTHTLRYFAEDNSSVLDINPDDVTPGVIGFVFTALFAFAVILIGIDMYRRVRRMQYRAEVQAEIEEELAGESEATGVDDTVIDAATDLSGPGDGAAEPTEGDAPKQ